MISDFNHSTPDRLNIVPNTQAIGQQYRHSGNNCVYTITGFSWCGDTDEWHVRCCRSDSIVECSRSITNFFGTRSNGEQRFVRVDQPLYERKDNVKPIPGNSSSETSLQSIRTNRQAI